MQHIMICKDSSIGLAKYVSNSTKVGRWMRSCLQEQQRTLVTLLSNVGISAPGIEAVPRFICNRTVDDEKHTQPLPQGCAIIDGFVKELRIDSSQHSSNF